MHLEYSYMSSTPLPHPDVLLDAVLDNVGVALLVVDGQGKFVFTNQTALQMFGWVGSVGGASLDDVHRDYGDYVFRDDHGHPLPLEEAPIIRALAGEEIPPQYLDLTLPDGRRKWLHAAALHFSVFGMTGVILIATDETEQVRLRRELEQAHTTEEFGLIVGGLAHDLNNMLSVISENLALLRTDERVAETPRARLEQMTVALDRGAALAARLTSYSRPQELQSRRVQVNDLVNVALKLIDPLLKSRIRVKAELGILPTVEIDPGRIEQVLVNLMLNAIDAMPSGGELTVRTEVLERAAMVEIALDEEKGKRATSFVRITVADTGIGIPEEIQANIFTPFFTTKSSGKGSGLGLATVYAIVRQHSGHIKVQSASNAGTKFSIYLPMEEGVSQERAA
jgi:signal transduction histidine kinase